MKLLVNFSGGRLVITGKVTGKTYEYLPSRDNGQLEVDEADAASLLQLTFTQGCGCSESSPVVQAHYFSEIDNNGH